MAYDSFGAGKWIVSGTYAQRAVPSLQMVGGAMLSSSGGFSSLPVTGAYALANLIGPDGGAIETFSPHAERAFLSASFRGSSGSIIQALNYLEARVTTAVGIDTLAELTDVSIASLAEANLLIYDKDGDAKWENKALSGDATISAAGALTLATVAVAKGGTGATTAAAARTNLGLVIGTDVQGYDAGLASIAALTTAADKMIYTTALDTYAVTGLSSFARTILDDADASTARTTLGVAINSDVQAFSPNLAALDTMGVTSGAGSFIVSNGAASFAYEDAATARGSLDLGSIATQNANSVAITGGSIIASSVSGSAVSGLSVTGGGAALKSTPGLDRAGVLACSGTMMRSDSTRIDHGATVSSGADYLGINSIPHLTLQGTDQDGKLNAFRVQISGGLLQVSGFPLP